LEISKLIRKFMENKEREEITKKWEESGILDGLTEMDEDHPMLKVIESIEKQRINELLDVKNNEKYSIPIYENGVKTKCTVDGLIGDEKYFELLKYGNGKDLPDMVNVGIKQ
jgi:hypothetical protein